MGWAKGKGLGVREDGVSEAIRLPVKLNSEGIGYKEVDNTHELADEYEKVLASLNQKYRSNNSSASSSVCQEEEEDSGKESQSSQRSIRVRHRYTKIRTAKDVSSYSQKDLNIIFAIKKSESSLPSSPSTTTSSEEKITNSNDKSSTNKDNKSIKKKRKVDDDVNRCGDVLQPSLSPFVTTSTSSNDSHYSRDDKSCDVVGIYLRLFGYSAFLSFP